MVSYYNSLAMFPQPSRPAPPTNPAIYSSYSHAYNQYQHDQNSNLQLYPGFTTEFGAGGGAWTPAHWPSQFPGTCRNYEWSVEAGAPGHPPPTTTPSSEPGLHSPPSRPEQTPGSPSPSDYSVPALHNYKPSLSPPPPPPGPGPVLHYKTEPTSSSELGLPTSPSVSGGAGAPPNISIGSSLEDDCPSPSPLSSRPQPARSPFEWMKKPPHPSPPSSGDPNGKI